MAVPKRSVPGELMGDWTRCKRCGRLQGLRQHHDGTLACDFCYHGRLAKADAPKDRPFARVRHKRLMLIYGKPLEAY